MPKKLQVLLRVLRLCCGRVSGACLFTELRWRFVFVQGDCDRTQVSDNGVSSSIFIQSRANFFLPFYFAAVFVQLHLLPISNVSSNERLSPFHKHHDGAGVFEFPVKLCLCKEKSKFGPVFATSKGLFTLTISLSHWNDYHLKTSDEFLPS